MALRDLALSRSRLDKVSEDRHAPGLLERLLQDPATHLLLVHDGAGPLQPPPTGTSVTGAEGGTPALQLLHGDAAAALVASLGGPSALATSGEDPATEPVAVHLGRFPSGDDRFPAALVGVLLPGVSPESWPDAAPSGPREGLRQLGALLSDLDAGALTEAVALHHWHLGHVRCPRCGAGTRVACAGHERVCAADGTTQHPRHDPAVIMTVTDPADRLLLGHQGRWPAGRYSAFAGFVEPGESLEQAVARELLEEAAVHAGEMVYLGSQPWPFPASLMLAFHVATDDVVSVPDGHEITEVRWFERDELVAAVAAAEVSVPPAVSVARRLIERWLGAPLVQSGTWR